MKEITLRTATPADAGAIRAIYAPNVEQRAVSFEEVTPSVEEFEQRISATLIKGFPYFVAECDGKIVGYTYAGAFHPRSAYRHSVETTVYVADGCHHQGIGRILVGALEAALRQKGYRNCYAIIAYPCTASDPHLTTDSVLFHERMGYTTVAHLHHCGKKFGRLYDVVYMEHIL